MSLRGRAHHAGDFVGEVLLVFEPVELGEEDGAADRVEGAVEAHRVLSKVEKRGDEPVQRLPGIGPLAAGGVDAQLPVGNHRHPSAEAQRGALLD